MSLLRGGWVPDRSGRPGSGGTAPLALGGLILRVGYPWLLSTVCPIRLSLGEELPSVAGLWSLSMNRRVLMLTIAGDLLARLIIPS